MKKKWKKKKEENYHWKHMVILINLRSAFLFSPQCLNPFLHISSNLTHWRKMLQENIVGKGEITQYEQFHLLPQCFLCDLYLKIIQKLQFLSSAAFLNLERSRNGALGNGLNSSKDKFRHLNRLNCRIELCYLVHGLAAMKYSYHCGVSWSKWPVV